MIESVSEITPRQIDAGIALYTRWVLALYNRFMLGIGCRFLWGCPSARLLELYNNHMSGNHLDIGVGTGYFIDNCETLPSNPRIALLDLNRNSLDISEKRLARFNPEVYRRNVLEPFELGTPAFDSVGITNVLHCLPGNMISKQTVFENIKEVLNPGGVVFGSTILYRGIRRNASTTLTLKVINRVGIMTNLDDDVNILTEYLSDNFRESSVRIVGCEALFYAVK